MGGLLWECGTETFDVSFKGRRNPTHQCFCIPLLTKESAGKSGPPWADVGCPLASLPPGPVWHSHCEEVAQFCPGLSVSSRLGN